MGCGMQYTRPISHIKLSHNYNDVYTFALDKCIGWIWILNGYYGKLPDYYLLNYVWLGRNLRGYVWG